jgi:hypothetical protein
MLSKCFPARTETGRAESYSVLDRRQVTLGLLGSPVRGYRVFEVLAADRQEVAS